MISILLPCYKSEKLISQFYVGSDFNTDVEIIFYDNGGNGSDFNFIPHKVIGDGINIGLNRALNECAKVAKGEYFYFPHTDMVLLYGWDVALLQAAKNCAPEKFLFCSRSIEPTQGHTPFHIIKDYGREPSEFRIHDLDNDFAEYEDHGIVTAYRMPFFCHRKLWEKMDGVDPNYFSYGTDDDFFMTAYHVGVRKFWMINQSLVYHMQGKSNQQQTVDKDSRKPYDYFNDKWKKLGYDTDQPIDKLMQSLIPWNIKLR